MMFGLVITEETLTVETILFSTQMRVQVTTLELTTRLISNCVNFFIASKVDFGTLLGMRWQNMIFLLK